MRSIFLPFGVCLALFFVVSCADEPPTPEDDNVLLVDREDVPNDTEYESLRQAGKADFLGLWPNVGMETKGYGRDLTDGDQCHSETSRLWDCTPGDGKISFSACPSGGAVLSKSLYNAMDDFMGTCIERAVGAAGDDTDFKRAHVYSGGGIVNDRQIRNGGWRSLHSWGRAVDIGDIKITFDDGSTRRYSYRTFARNKTETKDYLFFDRFRDCWGNSVHSWVINNSAQLIADNTLGSLSCDDDPSGLHCDHMHISVSSAWLTAWCNAVYE